MPWLYGPSLVAHAYFRGPNPSARTLTGGHEHRANVLDNGLRTFPLTLLPLGRVLSQQRHVLGPCPLSAVWA